MQLADYMESRVLFLHSFIFFNRFCFPPFLPPALYVFSFFCLASLFSVLPPLTLQQ
jgi:hypothetical protein